MKTKFFSRLDAVKLRRAKILVLSAIAVIAVSIPGLIFLKGNSVFVFTNFTGFVLVFSLPAWLRASLA